MPKKEKETMKIETPVDRKWRLDFTSDFDGKTTRLTIQQEDVHILAEIITELLEKHNVEVEKTITYKTTTHEHIS